MIEPDHRTAGKIMAIQSLRHINIDVAVIKFYDDANVGRKAESISYRPIFLHEGHTNFHDTIDFVKLHKYTKSKARKLPGRL